eukprot:8359650-Pyramimonas_sp.AAC.1
MSFTDANTFCETFTGDPAKPYTMGLTDWRLPQSPLEAGRLCGSGCHFDYVEIWVSFGGAFPLVSTTLAAPIIYYLGHN